MAVWIDTDMGFDDLMAILLLEAARVDLAGISLVAGNTPLPVVADNARRAAAAFGRRWDLHAGRDRPLLASPVTAEAVLGATGMPSAGRRLPPAAVAAGPLPDAFQALCAWLEGGGEGAGATVLALGPLTNIAVLALARPDLAARIGDLVWMGGSAGAGNHTAAAEFNAYADPEAVAVVLGAGLPLRMVGLDLCRQVPVTLDDVAPLRAVGGDRSELLADLLEGYVRIAIVRGRPSMGLYDPVAAAALAAPGAVAFAPARIAVELCGTHTRGMTVVDRRQGVPANAAIAVEADAPRIRALTLDALLVEACR